MYFRCYGWRYVCSSQGCSRRRQTHTQPWLGYKLCAVIPVVGERTHGTSFRVLKVTSQVATTGGGVCSLWLSCWLMYWVKKVICRTWLKKLAAGGRLAYNLLYGLLSNLIFTEWYSWPCVGLSVTRWCSIKMANREHNQPTVAFW